MAGAELVGGPAWRVSGVGSPRPPAFFCGGRCVFEFAPRTGTSVAPAIAAETVRLVETKKRLEKAVLKQCELIGSWYLRN